MVNKKGYFYVIELLLVVLIIVGFILTMPESERSHTSYEEQENIKAIGYGTLLALDEQGILSKYIEENITKSNFTVLSEYIYSSLNSIEAAKIEYIYNNLSAEYQTIICLNSSGSVTKCGDVAKRKRELLVSTMYTYSKNPDPVTIRLFLRRYYI